jgi:hypothetical protein
MRRAFHFIVLLALANWPAVALCQLGEDRLYRSAYFLGRGDTGISLADEEDAIFYNPAGIALGKGIYKKTTLLSPQVEVSESTRDLTRRLAVERNDAVETVLDQVGKPNHAGYQNFTGLVLRRAALGAIASGGVDVLASKSPEYGGLEIVQAAAVQNVGLTFSLAEAFWGDKLLLGVTGKYLTRGKGYLEASAADAEAAQAQLDDQANFLGFGEGGGADVGLMLRGGGHTNPSFGITVNDVGDTQIEPSEETKLDLDVKQTVNVGVSVEPGTRTSKFRLLADYRDALGAVHDNPRLKTHLGAELTVLDAVGVSTGLSQGYPCFGLYLDLYFLRADFGTYTEELSEHAGRRPDTRYFGRIKIGF